MMLLWEKQALIVKHVYQDNIEQELLTKLLMDHEMQDITDQEEIHLQLPLRNALLENIAPQDHQWLPNAQQELNLLERGLQLVLPVQQEVIVPLVHLLLQHAQLDIIALRILLDLTNTLVKLENIAQVLEPLKQATVLPAQQVKFVNLLVQLMRLPQSVLLDITVCKDQHSQSQNHLLTEECVTQESSVLQDLEPQQPVQEENTVNYTYLVPSVETVKLDSSVHQDLNIKSFQLILLTLVQEFAQLENTVLLEPKLQMTVQSEHTLHQQV